MGETTEVTSDGWSLARNGGAGDARAVCRRRRTPRFTTQHTASRRRVRSRRASTVTSPLSASRADEKQFSTSTEQVRERRARVGGHGGRAAGASGSGRRGRRQERRPSAKGDSMVGAHGRAAAGHVPAGQRAAALRDGATPGCALAAARRVTSPHLRTSLSYHAYIPLSGRSDSSECTRVPEYYRLDNLFIWDSRPPDRAAERVRVLCDMCDRVV
ncbi:uncharacterized protein LOC124536039 isoform X3 [Vanessa cardui]|uniref:uncharacterized protein LOC124536039 isoform X3 n=1 Tax=Vanessa cardui TaxID=171605 RepID=UPI001F136556|nr:uncharacterized protein LOC124536039 isoform X3 [Vanessa cardui]